MLDKIAGTFAARTLTALLNFFVVYFTARHFGAEGRGLISIIILSVSITGMISSLAGGPSLIYLASRHNLYSLLLPSYAWGILTAGIFTLLFSITGLIPSHYFAITLLMTLLSNLSVVNFNILIGKEKIIAGNLVNVIHIAFLTLFLVSIPGVFHSQHVDVYFYSYMAGLGLALLFGTYRVSRLGDAGLNKNFRESVRNLFQYGFYTQLGNLMQLLNYRLSYYLIVLYEEDKKPLGVYATSVAIAEGIWLISSSFSTVQYATISNINDPGYAGRLTVSLGKLSLWLSAAGLAVLSFIPDGIYTQVFGKEFGGMPRMILLLSPGIAVFSLCALLSHYFAGTGRMKTNTIASGIGFAVTLVAAPYLIKTYSVTGAILTANLSYFASTVFLLILFLREREYSLFQIVIPLKKDFQLVQNEIRNYVRNYRNR